MMDFKETLISGNYLIDLDFKKDLRGFFARFFCNDEFLEHGLNTDWVQFNNSLSSKKGTLRGPHIQMAPHEETKLVKCVQGSVWDVAIDLRKNSKTFGKWHGAELDSKKGTMMYIPNGVAHGVLSLQDNSEIIYMTSSKYSPKNEISVLWNDPLINIKWPIKPSIMSIKESHGSNLEDIKKIYLD
jgi:dTDP-4-dehydrorhamnose 3,5-epimerase